MTPAAPSRRRACLLGAAAWAAWTLPPAGAATATHREIGWGALVPAGWDAARAVPEPPLEAASLADTDPRAQAMLAAMRRALDGAPVVGALDGAEVRLAGYVVPLRVEKTGLREFLLVPYLGACIHSPPPAANQIVRCRAERPIAGLRPMEAVWAAGRLDTVRSRSAMGEAGYGMRVAGVQKQGFAPASR